MNPGTPWAHHAMSKPCLCVFVLSLNVLLLIAHVIEETHDAKDGVEFLSSTRPKWEKSAFGGHITWHLTLHYFGIMLI